MRNDADRWMFLRTLGGMAKRTGFRVHALMEHILVEQNRVRQKWVVETLHMGPAPNVSRFAKLMGGRIAQGDRGMRNLKVEIVEILS